MNRRLLLFLGILYSTFGVRGVEIQVTNGSDPLFPAPAPEGSLRKALEIAKPGDVIRLARSLIVNLQEDITVLPGLDGLVITGPEEGDGTAQIRAKIEGGDFRTQLEVLNIRSDNVTVRNLQFRDMAVSVGYELGSSATITGVKVMNCLFTQAGLLSFQTVINGVVELNRFELTQSVSGGKEALLFAATEGCIARKNVFDCGPKVDGIGGLADVNLTVEENTGTGEYHLAVKTATVRKNVLSKSRLFVDTFHQSGPGHVLIEENECGVMHTQGVNMTVRKNKVSGKVRSKKDGVLVIEPPPADEEVFTSMNILGVDPDATGPITVVENEVSGGIVGLKVSAASTVTAALVQGNTINNAGFNGLAVVQEVPMTVVGNTLNRCGSKRLDRLPPSGIFMRDPTPDLIIEGNTINDSGPNSAGIRVLAGEPLLKNNTITGGMAAGISVNGGAKPELQGNTITRMAKGGLVLKTNAEVDATGLVLKENGIAGIIVNKGATLRSTNATIEASKGPGIVFRSEGKGTVSGGAINGSTGPGISLVKNSLAEIRGTVFSGNKGPGIDLAPAGVTLNTKTKQANGDIDFPDALEYDASARLIRGTVEAGAIVQLYKAADGEGKGDKAHGEGAIFIGETSITANGVFAISPGPAQEGDFFTLTATRLGAQPVTSEFSENIEVDPTPATEIVSVSSLEEPSDGNSFNDDHAGPVVGNIGNRTISDSGRFVVFHSEATNLVPGDTNGGSDIFLRDRMAGTTERVNVDSAENEAADGFGFFNGSASISADGRWIAFCSSATNLVSGDGNHNPDIFLRDRESGTTIAVTDPTEQPGMIFKGGGFDCSISADGNVVAFVTVRGGGHIPPGTGDYNLLAWTRSTGQFEDITVGQAVGSTSLHIQPRLSGDGRYVIFGTNAQMFPAGADNSPGIYLRDRQTGTLERINRKTDGTTIGAGGGVAISGNGRYVAFTTPFAGDPADSNGQNDIYVRDRQAGTLTWASLPPTGGFPAPNQNLGCALPSLSGDGRYLAFQGPGNYVSPEGATFLVREIFVRDFQRGLTALVSLGAAGDVAGDCRFPILTADGRQVAFDSPANNLTPGDTNNMIDVFVRDITGDFPE